MNVIDKTETDTKNDAGAYLIGTLLEVALRQFQALETPWGKVPQEQQQVILRTAASDIRQAVREAVVAIASNQRTTLRAQVESVAFKNGDVKAVLKMHNTIEAHSLANVTGGHATIVIEHLDMLLEIPASALEGDPDEPPLFEDEDPEDEGEEESEEAPPAGAAEPREPGAPERAAVAKYGDATEAFVEGGREKTLEERLAAGEPAWPFPSGDKAAGESPPQSLTVERSQPGTRTARGREKTAKALAAGAKS